MELRLTLRMNNAAFEPEAGPEVARILGDLAGQVDERDLHPGEKIHLFDENGNRVGIAEVLST